MSGPDESLFSADNAGDLTTTSVFRAVVHFSISFNAVCLHMSYMATSLSAALVSSGKRLGELIHAEVVGLALSYGRGSHQVAIVFSSPARPRATGTTGYHHLKSNNQPASSINRAVPIRPIVAGLR